MDHITSLMNTLNHDMMGEFHSASVDSFSSPNSSYPMVQYNHMTSVNSQGQLEYNPSSYSLAASQQYGHSVPQGFQANISDRQMASTFICQNQPQHHADFYPFQAQTPPFFPQNHQPGPNQLLQSPTSPCHNQTTPVNIYQSHSPHFPSMSCQQGSPRHPGHHQTPQVPLVCSPNNQQMQQHQPGVLMNCSTPPQRPEQSKLVGSKQKNNLKDHVFDAQFYSNQCSPQRTDTSLNNLHKAQACVSSYGHMMQPSSAHMSHVFQTGGANSGNKSNGDSWPRSLQGGQLGASSKTHTINQIKHSTYANPHRFEQPTSTISSNLPQSRYGQNENISSNSPRIQKASPVSSGQAFRPQLSSNPNSFPEHSILPAYSNMASSKPSKTPPNKLISDYSTQELSSVQKMHYKSRNPHTPSSHLSRDGKNTNSPGNISNRSVRSVNKDTLNMENLLYDSSQMNVMDNTNPCSVFSVAAVSETAKGGSRGSRVRDTTVTAGSKANGLGKVTQKNTCGNVSPVHWYRCPSTSVVSSFQSDIEAMQADVASYVSTSGTSRVSNRAPVAHGTPTQRSVESNASCQNGLNRTSQPVETSKGGSVSKKEGQYSDKLKSESQMSSRSTRAEALAAIQIKQEIVDNLNKYKTVSSNSTTHNLGVNTTPATKEVSSGVTSVTHSIKDANNLTNRAPVKNTEGNVHSKQQPDILARRHSSAEFDTRASDALQNPNPSANRYQHKTVSKALDSSAMAAPDVCPQSLKVVDRIGSGQVPIQNRRYTVPCLPDQVSPRCETMFPPDQKQNVGIQRSPVERLSKGNLDFPSQSIIHHLFDQVHSIETQYLGGQQQNMTTTSKTPHRDAAVDRGGQRGPSEMKAMSAREDVFDTWRIRQTEGNSPARGIEQSRNNIVASVIKNQNQSSNQGNNSTKSTSYKNNVPNAMKGNEEKSVANSTLRNSTDRETAFCKQKLIKMENFNEPSKPALCYIVLHGHKLICLKSDAETLLLLCQFQLDCFPDKSVESINNCIDRTLQINRKALNHPDSDRIIEFLTRSGYHLGSVVQTISLADARRVYHHLYSLPSCTDSACVIKMFQHEVDLDTINSALNKLITKDLKQEKKSAYRGYYTEQVLHTDSGLSSSKFIENGDCQSRTEDVTQQPKDKPLNSQPLTSSQPQSPKDCISPGSDYTIAYGKDVDCDESDDLILVEASEDPHIISWTGNTPKTGGLCNTIVGLLRSYIHETERFLVVDDLCKVFGPTDFYEGVERENIILYSCCSEISNFLNAISTHFPPLQSLRDSLVKEKDIGIHITDANYVPLAGVKERSIIGNTFLKRPLCKQEVIDDECSSPKQFRFENFAQASELGNKQSLEQKLIALKQRELAEDNIDNDSLGCILTNISQTQNVPSVTPGMNGKNNLVPVVCSDTSNSAEEHNLPLVVKSSGQSLQEKNAKTDISSDSLAPVKKFSTTVQNANSEVSSNLADRNSLSSVISISSSQTFENNNDRKSMCGSDSLLATTDSLSDECSKEKSKQHALVNANEIYPCEPPQEIACDTICHMDSSSNLVNVKEVDGASLVQPNYLPSPESSRSITSRGEPSPVIIDLNNTIITLSAGVEEKVEQNKSKSEKAEFASQNEEREGDSLPDVTEDNTSCILSTNISVEQLLDSEGRPASHGNDPLKTTVGMQAENVQSGHLINGAACSLEDLISTQQNLYQEKISTSTSSILKTRVEKLLHALATRKNNDLPLPRLFMDNNLDLSAIATDGCSDGKSISSGISRTEIDLQKKLSNVLNSSSEIPIGNNTITSAQSEIKSSFHNKNNNSDLCNLDALKVRVAAIDDLQVTLPDSSLSSQPETSSHRKERFGNFQSVLKPDEVHTPLSFLPLSRYFPGDRRSMDDTDVIFSSNTNPLGIRGAYAKLWQEHRALLGVVNELRKSLTQAQTEKEKSDRVSKYYEGVIRDIESTFMDEDSTAPVVLSDN